MTDELLTAEEAEFKEKILQLERESISNITKTDDKILVAKIIRMYEEKEKK